MQEPFWNWPIKFKRPVNIVEMIGMSNTIFSRCLFTCAGHVESVVTCWILSVSTMWSLTCGRCSSSERKGKWNLRLSIQKKLNTSSNIRWKGRSTTCPGDWFSYNMIVSWAEVVPSFLCSFFFAHTRRTANIETDGTLGPLTFLIIILQNVKGNRRMWK